MFRKALIILFLSCAIPAHAQFPLNPVLLEDGVVVPGSGRRIDMRDNIAVTYDTMTAAYKIDSAGGGAGEAAGNDTQVQFNDGGLDLGGDTDLLWDKNTNTLTVGGTASVLAGVGSSGVLTLGGTGGTNNENLTLDFETTIGGVDIDTTTGVEYIDFGPSISLTLQNDESINFGTSNNSGMMWISSAKPHLQMYTNLNDDVNGSGYVTLVEKDDIADADRYPLANATNPTLRIYSADATVAADYAEFSHDQTDGVIGIGSGGLKIPYLDCSGNANGGALTASATGLLSCTDDDTGAAAGDITSVGDCLDGACLLTGGNITADSLTLAEGGLSDSSIISADIKNDTIDSDDYAAASIDNEHLADNACDSAEINTNAVKLDALDVSDVSDDIAGDIAAGELADNTVDSDDFVHEDWGEVTNASGSVVIDDSIAVTSWNLTTPTITTSIDLPAGAINTATEIAADIITHTQTLDSDQADTKCIWFEDPTAADDFKSIWSNKTANDFLFTEIWAETDQTVVFGIEVDDGSPASVDTVALVATSSEVEDTSLDGDTTLAAGEEIDLSILEVSGTPTWCNICFTGQWVD